jgi:hypothetical protein
VDGAELSEGVVIAHFEPGRLAFVFQVLRLLADGAIGIEFVPFANPRRSHDGDMMLEPAAIAKHHAGSNDAIWSDVDVSADLRGGIDDGGLVNHDE